MFRRIFLAVLWSILSAFSLNAQAEATIVAVAANFTKPMTEIAAAFEKATGHTAKLSFGSTGKFVTQIENGAPFEVFFSADETGPAKLETDGFAVTGTCHIYALGTLVLWSATPSLVDARGQVLTTGNFKHLAIADPKLAPYGAAAVDFMQNQHLLDKIEPLLVLGENITQTHQFISTGNAELGFVALSQVIANGKINTGSGWIIPADQHKPIKQAVVLLHSGKDNPAAQALMAFLKSDSALAIIKQYGYQLP
jgi:molybdate transport system substrate-binding protein